MGPEGPEFLAQRLRALRAELAGRGLQGFLVPRADEHQGEYIPPHARRLEWLTGFTGSAGLAVVLADQAAIFVDGRYTLQAQQQTDGQLFAPHHLIDEPPGKWISQNLAGGRLGYDPWLHSADQRRRLGQACERVGAELTPCESNPLDEIWVAQPPHPIAAILPQDIRFAGRDSAEKRRRIAAELEQAGAQAAFLSAPDSIAWLLNVRGADVECSPLPHSFVLLKADGCVQWFVDARKQV
ncbi:MAG: aminopeptidase P family N-terminal domain-containing protein, partial [Alphaproteobacteria bacterium]|nr:aminopeptidase P family N-terminal domain-containing protein [Alphaproteobacteria bacterium]